MGVDELLDLWNNTVCLVYTKGTNPRASHGAVIGSRMNVSVFFGSGRAQKEKKLTGIYMGGVIPHARKATYSEMPYISTSLGYTGWMLDDIGPRPWSAGERLYCMCVGDRPIQGILWDPA